MTEHGICAKCKKSVGCLYADDRITGCKKFVLEPELELANEEWFCGLSTEEKAECLTNISFNTGYDSYNIVRRKIMEWLKQPHTVKE